ncbi:ABC transporter substrate-binding protein [Streptomyces sp. NPDC048057]|uniref:ABC transporter substrate-binding protein n=1 Tax=Streptomyces sp. NPDC048057 TaxID=3155628 RepID=UPI0033DD797D
MTTPAATPVTTTPYRVGSRLRCVLVALGLLLATAGCAGSDSPERVSIMVPWTQPAEFQAFYSLVKDFERDTDIQVDVQVTRALTQQLDASVKGGSPPDLAVLPSVSAIVRYAGDKYGLQPLDTATVDIGAYLQPFGGLSQVKGTTYAVPVKVDVKSLVWYDSKTTEKPPTDSTDALAGFTSRSGLTWCLGLASGPTSGWPGADWIADFMLSDAGAEAYARWVSGSLAWTSPEVERAWSRWRELLGERALKGADGRSFSYAAQAMTTPSPVCQLAHGARAALAADSEKPTRLDFAEPSTSRPVQVSGDFVGMFTDDNPSARRFVAHLAGVRGQQSWIDAQGTSAFSAHTEVTGYANTVQQRIATILNPRSGYRLCFSAADVMPPDVAAAFYRAVLDYADAANSLSEQLTKLKEMPLGPRNLLVPENAVCSTPT